MRARRFLLGEPAGFGEGEPLSSPPGVPRGGLGNDLGHRGGFQLLSLVAMFWLLCGKAGGCGGDPDVGTPLWGGGLSGCAARQGCAHHQHLAGGKGSGAPQPGWGLAVPPQANSTDGVGGQRRLCAARGAFLGPPRFAYGAPREIKPLVLTTCVVPARLLEAPRSPAVTLVHADGPRPPPPGGFSASLLLPSPFASSLLLRAVSPCHPGGGSPHRGQNDLGAAKAMAPSSAFGSPPGFNLRRAAGAPQEGIFFAPHRAREQREVGVRGN